MNLTDAQIRERHAFIDEKIQSTLDALADPRVRVTLGGNAIKFANTLENAVIPDIKDGIVSIPESDSQRDALAIIALDHGEVIRMDSYFASQTRQQKTNTLEVMEVWEPQFDIDDTYRFLIPERDSSYVGPPVELSPQSLAYTGTTGILTFDTELRRKVFANIPEDMITLRQRPVMILGLGRVGRISEAEMVHELQHADQAINDPVIFMKSQRALDMFTLGEELEASAAGSAVAQAVYANTGEVSGSGQIQMKLDLLRQAYFRKYGISPDDDPYKPTGMLLKWVHEAGLQGVMHQTISYEALIAATKGGTDGKSNLDYLK